jgi:hypothetical protein
MQIDIEHLLNTITADAQRIAIGLDKLSRYTNGNMAKLREDITSVLNEIGKLQEADCPRNKDTMNEYIEIKRLERLGENEKEMIKIIKHQKLLIDADKPKELKKTILWIVAVGSSIMAIALGLDRLLN